MKAESNTAIEMRVEALAAELEQTRTELRAFQKKQRHSALSIRFFYLSGLIVIGSIVGMALSPPGAAQKTVTAFDAPFIVRSHSGKTIAEITDGSSGSYGLNIYNPNGGSEAVAFLGGTNNGNGKLQLGDAAGNSLVEAGVLPGNIGVVRVYPMNGKSPIPIPNFIKGAASQ